MAFTEFYQDPVNGVDTASGSSSGAPTATDSAGAWDGTSLYTASSGTPFSAITAGMFAAIRSHGATSAAYIGRVVTIGGGGSSLTLSTTAVSGTNPGALTTGNADCAVGGAVKTIGQVKVITGSTPTDSSGDMPRFNCKNNATNTIAASLLFSANGPYVVQGYNTSPGDANGTPANRAIVDFGGAAIGAALTGNNIVLADFIFQNGGNGGGGSDGFDITGNRCAVERITVHDVGQNGINSGGNSGWVIESETYNCNKTNTANRGGMNNSGTTHFLRCISHDNANATPGFIATAGFGVFQNCIAAQNAGDGFSATAGNGATFTQCDAFSNTLNGFHISNSQGYYRIENSNAVLNGGVGILVGVTGNITYAVNCGFDNNTGGQTTGSTTALVVSGSITYGATPYNNATAGAAPRPGDFTIALSAAQAVGRGNFIQASADYSATSTAFPDVGAVQHQPSGGGSGASPLVDGGLVAMRGYLGDFLVGKKIYSEFTNVNTSGVPTSLVSGTLAWLKNGSTVTPSGGITFTVDANGTGSNILYADTSVDTTTFTAGADYVAYLSAGTVGGTSVVGAVVLHFSLENRSVTVDASGNVSLTATNSPIANTGTAQAGAAGSITLAATASATNNLYNGCLVRIVSGPGAGQARRITGYVGSTQVATVDNNWTTNPTSSSVYAVIMEEGASLNASLQPTAAAVSGNVAGSVGSVTGAVGSVTAAVTVGTNNDKTGYALSTAGVTAVTTAMFAGMGPTSTVVSATSGTAFVIGTGIAQDIVGSGCQMTGGTAGNLGIMLLVLTYNPATGAITVSGGYNTTPAAGDTCAFIGRLQ